MWSPYKTKAPLSTRTHSLVDIKYKNFYFSITSVFSLHQPKYLKITFSAEDLKCIDS